MMTPRNRPKQTSDRDDWDDEAESTTAERRQPAGATGQRRTSKHRAPKQAGKPPQRKPKTETPKAKEKEQVARKPASLVERISPDFFTRRLIRTIWVIFCSVAAVALFLFLYFFFDGWRFFALRDFEVEGNVLLKRENIGEIVKRETKDGVLRADLRKIREEVYKTGLVKSVEVTRMLPDMIKITVEEREPFALARLGNAVVCVDREGVMFGDQSLMKSKGVTPLLNGLEEKRDEPSKYNQQRLAVYQKLMADLDSATEKLSKRIQEVYFDDRLGIRVTIEAPDKEGVIAVFLGNENFRVRFNAALDVLDAINRQDLTALNVFRISDAEKLISGARISYLNATSPNRVVVGLEE
ncbi:MAG: FtsQ-type POTRA domain-containing protein [Blastocatellia bacterium]|nr:FtsQ-type POTRA domain-containing protein [Blastocatellia bacterium]